MMISSDNISLSLSIILTVCQVLIVTALIILYKAYTDLKKKASQIQKDISSLTLGIQERTGTGLSTASETKRKWHKEGEESPTRVPTPPGGSRTSSYKEHTPVQCRTTEVTGSHRHTSAGSRYSQEMAGFPRDTSFTSARSRDSGTGSIATRSPQSSISYESKMLWQDPLSERDFKVVWEKPVSRDSQSSQSSPFRPSRNRKRSDALENQNELVGSRSSRLETMAIGMIGQEEEEDMWQQDEKERNENELRDSRLQTMAIGMIGMEEGGLTNEGYQGNHTGTESFSRGPKKPKSSAGKELARELSFVTLKNDKNPESKDTKYNEQKKIVKKWHKDGEESPTRVPTPPRNRKSKRSQNEVQDSHYSRLETMAIGMIGKDGNDHDAGRKNERSSHCLSQRKEATDEATAFLNDDEPTIDTRL